MHFPAPAPAASSQTSLGGAFTGINPNGVWKLFVVDDTTGDVGSMAGGWSLTITSETTAVATTTAVSHLRLTLGHRRPRDVHGDCHRRGRPGHGRLGAVQ